MIADRDDEAGPLDRSGESNGSVAVRGGQRLLRQERDPALDQQLADGDRLERRDADVDDVRPRVVEHRRRVLVHRAAPPVGDRGRAGTRPGHDPDELRPVEPRQRLEVEPGDPARPDQAESMPHRLPEKISDSSYGAVSSSWS